MTVTSLGWLAFMFAVVGVYWLLAARYRPIFLAAVSAGLLFYADPASLALLTLFCATTYALSQLQSLKKLWLSLSIFGVFSVVAFYKLQIAESPLDAFQDVAIPLGLSYYAFRVVHYLLEKYRGGLPTHTFKDYLSYLFFAPTILVGPIHRFQAFHHSHHNIRWNAAELSESIERMLIGYFKIVVIGNFLFSTYLAGLIGNIDPTHESLILYLEAVRGSLHLYFLFSGYSDVAIGFALMLGYRVMENFNNPFLKTNISEFWRSWHISLTSWSRDYIYMTAVGITRNPYFATLCSLLFIGIWHELSLRYVIWGLYHGIGIIFVNKLQKLVRNHRRKRGIKYTPPDSGLVKALKIFATANYFFFGYVIISQDRLSDALQVYSKIFFQWWI
jgi:alginate O-acetyltransferase complex protein AlgI